MDSYWIAFYKFCEKIGVKYKEKDSKILSLWADIAESCGWFYAFENKVIVSERPLRIYMKNEKLHHDGGPSVEFRDGWKIWNLDGIKVPQYIAETPGTQLDVKQVLAETNVDIRRLGLSKIPIEKILMETKSKELDSWKDYTLYLMDLGDDKIRKVLKMTNPSIGCYHMERVEDTCNTVHSALAWRNQLDKFVEPIILT